MTCNASVEVTEVCNATNTTSTTAPDIASARALQESFNKVQYVMCPLLLTVGLIGNTLTILTVSRPQFRQLNSRYILCALAVSDSLLLCTNPFNQQFMLTLLQRDIRALSDVMCKMFFVAYRTGKMTSSWFIVMVTVERFFAVWFPFRVKSIMTKKVILILIAINYVTLLTISSVWSFSTAIVDNRCLSSVVNEENVRQHKAFVLVGAICYSLGPMAILLTITPPIIARLVILQQRRQLIQHSAIDRAARDTGRITLMLIVIVIMYVICVTPITLVLILTFWTDEPFFSSVKPELIILTSVAQWLEQINHSMNFAVYVLCSRQFRLAFLNMVRCWGRHPGAGLVGTGAGRTAEQQTSIAYVTSGEEPSIARFS